MSAPDFGLLKHLPLSEHKDVSSMLRNLTSADPVMAATCALCLAVVLARADGITNLDIGDAVLRVKAPPLFGPRRPTPPPPAPRPVPA